MEKSILITNYELINFTGSELNTMTIAKRFKDMGYKVYVLAMYTGEPLLSKTKDCYNEVINLINDEFDFSNIEFDIVWAHHSFLLSWLIFEKKLKAKKVIVSSLSAKEYFEAIPEYANDLSLIIANSQETKMQLEQEGIEDVYLLENYSFRKYFERNIQVKELKNIAIITNHITEELMQAKEILINNKYNVVLYGFQGKRELITDKVLEQYDAIVTIGKTVQYAMSLKIPVYVYDIFGGEGYLTLENIEKNRSRNFSGRGFDKKTPQKIYEEITENFPKALTILDNLKEYAQENFCFEDKIDNVCELLEQKPSLNLDEFRHLHRGEVRLLMQAKQMYVNVENKYVPIKGELKDKEREINNLNERFLAIEKARENLLREKEQLETEKENLTKENKRVNDEFENYKNYVENLKCYKIHKKLKGLTGGENE